MTPDLDPVTMGYQVSLCIMAMLAMFALMPGNPAVKSAITVAVVGFTFAGLYNLGMLPF